MPASDIQAPITYTVWSGGRIHRGPAKKILELIQDEARADSAVKSLSLPQYAKTLVENAEFFVPKDALKYLEAQQFESEYDRALQYLAAMLSGGVRILNREP